MKKIYFVLGLMLIVLCLQSCIDPNNNDNPDHTVEQFGHGAYEEETTSAPDTTPHVKTDYEKQFEGVADATPDELVYSVNDGKVTITGYNGNAKALKLPDSIEGMSVTALSKDLFSENNEIEVLLIPDSVESIENGTLERCRKICALRIPNINSCIGDAFGSELGHLGNFSSLPTTLDTVVIGNNCESIPDYAFYNCTSLKYVRLGDGVKTVGRFAFGRCSDLDEIVFPSSLEAIGEYAFRECDKLYEVTIHSSVKSIGLGAFEKCNYLNSVTVPFIGGGEQYENTTFGYIFGSEHYTWDNGFIPASLKNVTVLGGVKTVPDNAFYKCDNIEKIVLSDGIEGIGICSFYSCKSLKDTVLPQSLYDIRDNAFFGCSSITRLDIPEFVKKIGIQAFAECRGLSECVLPDSVTVVASSTFYNCTSLEKIVFGKHIEKIGKNAFKGCTELKTVTGLKTDTVIEDGNGAITDSQDN